MKFLERPPRFLFFTQHAQAVIKIGPKSAIRNQPPQRRIARSDHANIYTP